MVVVMVVVLGDSGDVCGGCGRGSCGYGCSVVVFLWRWWLWCGVGCSGRLVVVV